MPARSTNRVGEFVIDTTSFISSVHFSEFLIRPHRLGARRRTSKKAYARRAEYRLDSDGTFDRRPRACTSL
jgi:hypothetical protein